MQGNLGLGNSEGQGKVLEQGLIHRKEKLSGKETISGKANVVERLILCCTETHWSEETF